LAAKYPLETVRELRQRRVVDQAESVAEQAARALRARAVEARVRQAREAAERVFSETRAAEALHLERGAQRAGDLARSADWQQGAEAQVREVLRTEAQAAAIVQREVVAEVQARRELARLDAAAEVVEAHREGWHAERAEAREHAEEEAALEQWTAKHHPSRAG
jgi:hypothetical protein